MKNDTSSIQLEYDIASKVYYVIWQPMVVVGAGSTRKAAINDLKEAAHFGIDTILNKETGTGS